MGSFEGEGTREYCYRINFLTPLTFSLRVGFLRQLYLHSAVNFCYRSPGHEPQSKDSRDRPERSK